MKYCKICKTNVNSSHKNCPLCGSYLSFDAKPFPDYEQRIEPNISYPDVELKEKTSFWKTKTNLVLLLLAVTCIALNWLTSSTSLWSGIVVCSIIFLIACVIRPIENKSKVYIQIMSDIPMITILVIAMELLITKFTSLAISIKYILPAVYGIAVILTDAMIIATHTQRTTGYYTSLLVTTLFAILPQLLSWIWLHKYQYTSMLMFIIFFFAVVNIGIVMIVNHKRIKEEYQRKMNI